MYSHPMMFVNSFITLFSLCWLYYLTSESVTLETIMHLNKTASHPCYLLLILFVGIVIATTLMISIVVAESASDYTVLSHINTAAPVQTHQVIAIHAPPGQVWQLMANVNQWSRWQKDISQPRMTGPFQAGNSFDWKSSGLSIHSTLSVATPNSKIVWSGPALGSFAIHSWTFSVRNGLTCVEVNESMDGWLVRLARPIFQKALDQSIKQWLQALKQAAEQPE